MPADELPLTDQQLERLVDLLLARLAEARTVAPSLLTVEDVCSIFQVSRAWVYENAGQLGALKLGSGPRARLRFDADRVMDAFKPLSPEEHDAKPEAKRRRHRSPSTQLLPVYDG